MLRLTVYHCVNYKGSGNLCSDQQIKVDTKVYTYTRVKVLYAQHTQLDQLGITNVQ